MIRLITRGDDAGSFRSANRAIREACEDGILRNVSLLAPGPFIEDAAEQLLDAPNVCFGLHACITAEWDAPRWGPVLGPDKGKALLDAEGCFPRHPMEHDKGKTPAKIILTEVEAQLARLRALSFDIRYMDTHMGFSWLKGVEEGMLKLAEREGLVYAPPVSRLPPLTETGQRLNAADRLLLGLQRMEDDKTYLAVGHPTYADEEMAAVQGADLAPGGLGKDRNAQRLMFLRGDILTYCRENRIHPVRYDELET